MDVVSPIRNARAPVSHPANFRGFGPGALEFFKTLAAQNTRDVFLAHKDMYEREARGPAEDLVADLCTAFSRRGVPLHGDPKRALFRINRDIRFARDKRPYKTNVGAVLTRTGDKNDPGIFYVQHGLDASFAAAGFHQPEPKVLGAFRSAIVEHPEVWRGVQQDLGSAGLALSLTHLASRLPRGIRPEAVGDLADVLRLKSFVVVRPLTAADLSTPSLVDLLTEFAASALPLLRFGWRAIEPAEL